MTQSDSAESPLRIVSLLACLLLSGLAGCGDDQGSSKSSDTGCDTNITYTCMKAGCMRGYQFCEGGELTECRCSLSGGSGGNALPDVDGSVADGSMDAATGTGGTDATGGADATGGTDETGGTATGGADATGGTNADTEICDNGMDDDGDGDTDCGDTDCTEHMCVDEAPADWQGPVALAEAMDMTSTCGGDYSTEVMSGGRDLTAAAAQCSGCQQCAPADCGSAVTLHAYKNDDTCGGNSPCNVTLTPDVCSDATIFPQATCLGASVTGIELVAPNAGAACTPGTQTVGIPDATFGTEGVACGLADAPIRGGCERNRVCAPKPGSGFTGQLCIVRSGDLDCPTGSYSEKIRFYTGIEDTRACAACGCTGECTYQVDLYGGTDTQCGSPLDPAPLTPAATCAGVDTSSGTLRAKAQISGGASCLNTGGDATGNASPKDPFTVCCTP